MFPQLPSGDSSHRPKRRGQRKHLGTLVAYCVCIKPHFRGGFVPMDGGPVFRRTWLVKMAAFAIETLNIFETIIVADEKMIKHAKNVWISFFRRQTSTGDIPLISATVEPMSSKFFINQGSRNLMKPPEAQSRFKIFAWFHATAFVVAEGNRASL